MSDKLIEELQNTFRTLVVAVSIVAACSGTFAAVLYAYQLGVSDATHARCSDVEAIREERLKP